MLRLPTPLRLLAYTLSGIAFLLASPGGEQVYLMALAPLPILSVRYVARKREAFMAGFLAALPIFVALALGTRRWGAQLFWMIALLIPTIYGLTFMAARLLKTGRPFMDGLLLPTLLALVEWAGASSVGFPTPVSTIFYRHAALLQPANLIGAVGVTWLYLLVMTPLSRCLMSWPPSKRPLARALALPALIIFLLYSAFEGRGQADLQNSSLRVVAFQPHIASEDYHLSWLDEGRAETIRSVFSRLRDFAEPLEADLIVESEGGEGGFPYLSPARRRAVASYARASGADYLMAGNDLDQAGRLYNVAHLMRADGRWGGRHTKVWTAPIGEAAVTRGAMEELAPLSSRHADLGILICLESLTPELSRRLVQGGAHLLVGITSDISFGASHITLGHTATAVLRAVENRRSTVWVSNGGPSLMVDPLGRIVAETRLGARGALVESLPIEKGDVTFYTAAGYLLPWTWLGLIPLAIFLRLRPRREEISSSAQPPTQRGQTAALYTLSGLAIFSALIMGLASPLWVARSFATEAPGLQPIMDLLGSNPIPIRVDRDLARYRPRDSSHNVAGALAYVLEIHGLYDEPPPASAPAPAPAPASAPESASDPEPEHPLEAVQTRLAQMKISAALRPVELKEFVPGVTWLVHLADQGLAVLHEVTPRQVTVARLGQARFEQMDRPAFEALWDGRALHLTGALPADRPR